MPFEFWALVVCLHLAPSPSLLPSPTASLGTEPCPPLMPPETWEALGRFADIGLTEITVLAIMVNHGRLGSTFFARLRLIYNPRSLKQYEDNELPGHKAAW
ncbi:uncharacterized protein ColSpa_02768 [Colletotrichum spaethianum]|uniref:Uncharacterized protein n=1 Tax=Colletotrichum spaethianum TaxID=700344 RepID=A0AA37L674_9PEZI|nr:uncharacterized protein ColSpa_02768 [Colletotrichum spaethianum]GKT42587.1 hypothetical protein ColSpa_02768 [Colletotrichum spaethianum]